MFGKYDYITFQNSENMAEQLGSFKPGEQICVAYNKYISGGQTWLELYLLSIAYRAYINFGSKPTGFTSCGHGVIETCDGITYKLRADNTAYEIGYTYQVSMAGSYDYSFLTLKSGNSISMTTYYGGDTILSDSYSSPITNTLVSKVGSATGKTNGKVTSTNATVIYPNVTLTNMYKVAIVSDHGDSGGLLYSQSNNIPAGILSGGDGTNTYFTQAVNLVANKYITPS